MKGKWKKRDGVNVWIDEGKSYYDPKGEQYGIGRRRDIAGTNILRADAKNQQMLILKQQTKRQRLKALRSIPYSSEWSKLYHEWMDKYFKMVGMKKGTTGFRYKCHHGVEGEYLDFALPAKKIGIVIGATHMFRKYRTKKERLLRLGWCILEVKYMDEVKATRIVNALVKYKATNKWTLDPLSVKDFIPNAEFDWVI